MFRERVLETSNGYRAFRKLISADNQMKTLVAEYLPPLEGRRLLDVGCGNADFANFLPASAVYVGLDNNRRYVNDARKRDLDIRELSVADLAKISEKSFDVVVAIGVLHHLEDAMIESCLHDCLKVMSPGAELLTIDPVWCAGQGAFERTMMRMDRGRHIRKASEYVELVGRSFTAPRHTIRKDLISMPYSHCIVQASIP